jgi:hypothetical protein
MKAKQTHPTETVKALYCDEQGICSRVSIDRSELTRTSETTTIRGWGRLDGPAAVWLGPRRGEYLIPRREVR